MIFVTVGTHEQPFDRLIQYMDELKMSGVVEDDIVMQIGFSTYEPKYCRWKRLFSYQEMLKNVEAARVVITHGGPSSFIMPLQMGKIPIVVPRRKAFGEHVNDHQMEFVRNMEKRGIDIIVINDIDKLSSVITSYDRTVSTIKSKMKSNNILFNKKLEQLVCKILIKSRV